MKTIQNKNRNKNTSNTSNTFIQTHIHTQNTQNTQYTHTKHNTNKTHQSRLKHIQSPQESYQSSRYASINTSNMKSKIQKSSSNKPTMLSLNRLWCYQEHSNTPQKPNPTKSSKNTPNPIQYHPNTSNTYIQSFNPSNKYIQSNHTILKTSNHEQPYGTWPETATIQTKHNNPTPNTSKPTKQHTKSNTIPFKYIQNIQTYSKNASKSSKPSIHYDHQLQSLTDSHIHRKIPKPGIFNGHMSQPIQQQQEEDHKNEPPTHITHESNTSIHPIQSIQAPTGHPHTSPAHSTFIQTTPATP